MTTNSGTLLSDVIVPFDSGDTFPTHSEVYGLGGYRTVATAANLLDSTIPAARRKEGMLVYAIDPGLVYQLASDLTTWSIFSAGSGGGGSQSDPVLAEVRYLARQYANIIMTNAEGAAAANRRGNYFADGFDTASYIRTSPAAMTSTNYTRVQLDSDSDGALDWVVQPSKSAISVLSSVTPIGNMTGGGGLAAAFNSSPSGVSGNTAIHTATNSTLQFAWIGQDFGSSKSINKVVLYPDTTNGFDIGSGNTFQLNFALYGSDTAPVNGSPIGATLLGTPVTKTADGVAAITLASNRPATETFRYVWVVIQNLTFPNLRVFAVSEMLIYQNQIPNNMTLYGGRQTVAESPNTQSSFPLPADPTYWRIWVDIQITDAAFQFSTDFLAYASRNGGSNWQLLPLNDLIGDTSGPTRLYRSDWVDASSVPSNKKLATKFVSANNRDFNFRRYLLEWRY